MRSLAEETVVYLMKKELPKKRALNLDIEIKNIRKVGCVGMIDSWKDRGKPYSVIELDNSRDITLYTFIEVLCHEFVHMMQFLDGRWVQKNTRVYWKGNDLTDTAYYKQPWEQEAFALQKPLAKYIIKEKLGMTIKKAKATKVRAYK